MSNTAIKAAVRRNDGSLWVRRCLRTARMLILAWATVVVLPGVAQAQLWKSNGCRASSGASIQLIPAVNFTLGNLPPVGQEIYRTITYVINYECSYYNAKDQPFPPGVTIPQLQALGGFLTLNDALDKAGLELQIVVNGDEGNPWRPNVLVGGGNVSEFRAIGPAYQGTTGPKVLTLVAKLLVKRANPPAARYPVPAGVIFRVMPTVGAGPEVSQVSISNTATRMQFVPQCLGAVSVDNVVQFNRVIAMSGYMGTLPQQQPFNVAVRINPSCNTGSLLTPDVGDPNNEWKKFLMLLSAQFFLQGTGRVDADGRTIILSNKDGVENGLKMQILDPSHGNLPVKIYPDPASRPVPLRGEVGSFGQLLGSNPAAVHTYMASLTPDAGKELKLGEYSTQVLVRINYY
ncbi:hypothetical protein S726_004034 [Salmonella enterica subsp. enterica]|nr:hypothetical protein [Salmonella enterica subsp. enterica]